MHIQYRKSAGDVIYSLYYHQSETTNKRLNMYMRLIIPYVCVRVKWGMFFILLELREMANLLELACLFFCLFETGLPHKEQWNVKVYSIPFHLHHLLQIQILILGLLLLFHKKKYLVSLCFIFLLLGFCFGFQSFIIFLLKIV